MDQLRAGQALRTGERLVSGNGWVEVVVQGDGNVVSYRIQNALPLWATATDGQPVTRLVMQDDGNLVAITDLGEPRWNAGTGGHPGAWLWMQDDGNLVIYDAAGVPLWASDTVQDFMSPTIRTTDGSGYSYVETSEQWKLLCQELPCMLALQWPGYATAIVETTIDGQPVVIQLWKGWCQKFLGLPMFPGGIGAEVGVYRRIPGHALPGALPFLPPPLDTFYANVIAATADNELWWPAPDLGAQLTFSLINPVTGEPVFTAGPQRSYWLAKWMNEDAYLKYTADQGFRIPVLPDAYILEYRINGQVGRWPELPAGPAAGGNAMEPGQVLASNGTLYSTNGRFRFVYQDDTNLVLYRRTDNVAQWDIRPQPGAVGVCVMQPDGNLVVYNASAQPVWASGTAGNDGARLVLQDDGNAVIYRPDGVPVWSSGTAQQVPPSGPDASGHTAMEPGEALAGNGTLYSANGRFRFVYQDDTNLVLYRRTDEVALWDIRPQPGGVGVCIMQTDGNLVVYNAAGQAVWASGTDGNNGARLIMQDDGNVVMYRPDGVPIWSTGTVQPVPPGGNDASGHDAMESGEQLGTNGTLYSTDGRFRFVYQDDTNLVLYRRSDNLALWDTRPKPGGVGVCVMQADGNLVVYNAAGVAVWASDTDGANGARLVMQNDGNVVIYRPDGVAVWATGTQG